MRLLSIPLVQCIERKKKQSKASIKGMSSMELTASMTAIANALACKLSTDEIALLAAILVQLGDTLALIAAGQSLCDKG